MNGVAIETFRDVEGLPGQRVYAFLAEGARDTPGVLEALRAFLDQDAIKPEAIHVIAGGHRTDTLQEVFDHKLAHGLRTGYDLSLTTHSFGPDGTLQGVANASTIALQRVWLTQLFQVRGGLLSTNRSVHYVKPSEKHTDQFLRASNVLQLEAEVELIAWSCLRFLPSDTAFVYTDTAGINIVGASIRALQRDLAGEPRTFAIDSFNSYRGLKDFNGIQAHSFWLISATTSGGLAKQIQETTGADPKRILTLFGLGVESDQVVCLLDLDEVRNPQGLLPVRSFDPSAEVCTLCAQGSSPIRLGDEQFLPRTTMVEPVLPGSRHLPKFLIDRLRRFMGRGVTRAHFDAEPSAASQTDIFFDLQPLAENVSTKLLDRAPYANPALEDRLAERIRQSAPADTTHVVHPAEPASEALAQLVQAFLHQNGSRTVVTVSARDLTSEHGLDASATVMVVASVMATGMSIVDLSRRLRQCKVQRIVYLVWLDRTPSERTSQQIQSHVRMGNYDVHVLERLPLPVHAPAVGSAWARERELLLKIQDDAPIDFAPTLQARLNHLDDAKSNKVRGLKDGLFWPDADQSPLALSDGFVFLPRDIEPSEVSQADIFLVVCLLLHRMRTNGAEPPLAQHALLRRVLDVGTFYRFNDAILQAAFLRASEPGELDYMSNEQESMAMALFLERVFTKDTTGLGRAAPEFALALATGHIRLVRSHLRQLLEKVDACQTLDRVSRLFLGARREEWSL